MTQDNVKKILNKTFKGCNVAEMSEGVYKYLNNKKQRAEVEDALNMFKCRIHTGGKTRKRKKKKKEKARDTAAVDGAVSWPTLPHSSARQLVFF